MKQQSPRSPLQLAQVLKGVNIPLFRAQGLVLTRGNGEVRHAFLSYGAAILCTSYG